LALETYAELNDGHYPAGAGSPEASLSLLYGEEYGINAEVLRGKTVPVEVVQAILDRGELLGPDTCGWHYVEGLTLADDSQIALVWDKVGLDHNGGQHSDGGHSVWFRGHEEYIRGPDWPEFLRRQRELMAARTDAAIQGRPALSAKVRLPSGEVVDLFDAPYTLFVNRSDAFASGMTSAAEALSPDKLRWHRLDGGDYTLTLRLTLNGWQTPEIKVEVSNGHAAPDEIIFEMAPPTSNPP
jgi:hypothetical protein